MLKLWTDQPVTVSADPATPRAEERAWEQAVYPIGNGRLGCTAFGVPTCERIQFNQDSLWVGNEDCTGGYQPFGDIYIDLKHHTCTEYRRELNLERALQTIRYRCDGVHYRRDYFASRPAGVLVMRFTADQPAALSCVIRMGNVHDVPIIAEHDTLVMRGDTSSLWYWRFHSEHPERIIADRQYASDQIIALDFEARVRVLHQGGTIRVDGDALVCAECDSLTLLVAADTNYVADRNRGWRGEHPHERLCTRIEAARHRTFDDLLAEHIADYQRLFNRMSIWLGRTPDTISAKPTAERVSAYGDQVKAGRVPDDRDLETLLYQYARYLMISSSSPSDGALPANLQGIWLINKRPPWRCDYHTDINLQMNYWFTAASNLAECFLPLAQWVDSIREVRKEETRRVLGVSRGWLMRSENGIFGGSTWHIQKGDSAWLCQNLWDHFTFTRDKDYLRRYAYPVMKEISEFWLDHLKELPDGTLVVPEGRSPEHGPVDVDGVTYDQCLCWDLFSNTIAAAEELQVDVAFREELADKLSRLLGPKVGRWGQLQEWMEDIDDPECDHRHISHLISVHPGRQIHAITTPELAAAARVSLKARRDHGREHPAWSRVWKACMFARLLDADSAYQELATTLATHIYGNLWAVHPPFQIDANFGYAAAVNDMLVQSHLHASSTGDALGAATPRAHVIHLLPALPTAWRDGSVTGMRVRGGFELDMSWRDGNLVTATLRCLNDSPSSCVVRYGDMTVPLELDAGEVQAIPLPTTRAVASAQRA
jgi:alpha-L-fucosidase 2